MDKRIDDIVKGRIKPDQLPFVLNDMLINGNQYQRKVAEGASVMMRRNMDNVKIAKMIQQDKIKSPRLYNRKINVKNSSNKQEQNINKIINTYFTKSERDEFSNKGVKLSIEELPEDIAGQNRGREVIIDPDVADRNDGITEDVVVHEMIHAQNRIREEKSPNLYLRKESIIDTPENIKNDTEIEEAITEAMTTARLQKFDETSGTEIPIQKDSLARRYNRVFPDLATVIIAFEQYKDDNVIIKDGKITNQETQYKKMFESENDLFEWAKGEGYFDDYIQSIKGKSIDDIRKEVGSTSWYDENYDLSKSKLKILKDENWIQFNDADDPLFVEKDGDALNTSTPADEFEEFAPSLSNAKNTARDMYDFVDFGLPIEEYDGRPEWIDEEYIKHIPTGIVMSRLDATQNDKELKEFIRGQMQSVLREHDLDDREMIDFYFNNGNYISTGGYGDNEGNLVKANNPYRLTDEEIKEWRSLVVNNPNVFLSNEIEMDRLIGGDGIPEALDEISDEAIIVFNEALRDVLAKRNERWYDIRLRQSRGMNGDLNIQELKETLNPGGTTKGFEFKGNFITNPMLDESGDNIVDPFEYYGKAYEDYIAKYPQQGIPFNDEIDDALRTPEGFEELPDEIFMVNANMQLIPFEIQEWIQRYKKNEERNYHTENMMELALAFGSKDEIERMKEILEKRNRGGMSTSPVDNAWMNENILPYYENVRNWNFTNQVRRKQGMNAYADPTEDKIFHVVDDYSDALMLSEQLANELTQITTDPSMDATTASLNDWKVNITPINKEDFKKTVWDQWPIYYESEGETFVRQSYDGRTNKINYANGKNRLGATRNPHYQINIQSFDPIHDDIESFNVARTVYRKKNASGHSLQRRIDKKKFNLANRQPLTRGQANTIARMVRTLPTKTNARLVKVKDGYNIYVRRRG
jgi:hypothetical protein